MSENYFSKNGLQIIDILEEAGFEAYFVGGCVRDYLMGRESHDEDITTSATPDEIEQVLREFNGHDFIDNGGRKFGTVLVRGYEVTTFRNDGAYTDSRHPDSVKFSSDIEDDLKRRDLTVNAIAYSPKRGFVDPFKGREDIQNHMIRAVGNPTERITEDPLRIMRAVRFANVFDFKIDPALKEACTQNDKLLERISKERIRDELIKTLSSETLTSEKLLLFQETGIFKQIAPELDKCFFCSQNNDYHYTDVGRHTLDVVSRTPLSPDTGYMPRLAALLHDIGKPEVKTEKNGKEHFYGHADVSGEIANKLLSQMKFSNHDRKYITALVTEHEALADLAKTKHPDRTIKNFLLKTQNLPGHFYKDLLLLQRADQAAHILTNEVLQNNDIRNRIYEEKLLSYIEKGLCRTTAALAINGRDLMENGIDKMDIEQMKEKLLREVIDKNLKGEDINNKEALTKIIPHLQKELNQERKNHMPQQTTNELYSFTPSPDNFIQKLIVHASCFHADDVLCAAVARSINPDVTIERVIKVPEQIEPGTLVADIGRGTYDHHQKDAKVREDGHKYAAIGLVLSDERIKQAFLNKTAQSAVNPEQAFNTLLKEIEQIEDSDNGIQNPHGEPFISEFVSYSNPVWDSDKNADEAFIEAADNIKTYWIDPIMQERSLIEPMSILDDKFETLKNISEQAEERAAEIIEDALDNMEDHIAVLDRFAPWDKLLVPSEAEFVIYPSNRGGYNLQCVPPEVGSFEKKVELPDWSDNMPKGCTFEHPGKFLAAFDTLDHALAAAKEIEKDVHIKEEKPFNEMTLEEQLAYVQRVTPASPKPKTDTHHKIRDDLML